MSRKPRGKGTRIDRVFVDETTGSTVVTDEDQYIGLTLFGKTYLGRRWNGIPGYQLTPCSPTDLRKMGAR
jgi:hypothetical protein